MLLNNKEWHFNRVFMQNNTSHKIFNILWPVLNVIIMGRRVSLIALRRTYSGKTYTITKLLRMTVKTMLDGSHIHVRKVYAQFVEIYRKDQHLYDLGGNAKTAFQYNKANHRLVLDNYRSIDLKKKRKGR